jgi:uncharacterized protein YkwD
MKRQAWKRMQAWLLVVAMLVSVVTGIGTTKTAKAATKMGVTYTVHVQTYGDQQGWVHDGTMAGTKGQAKRLEEIRVKLTGDEYSGSIQYKTHIQSYGWQDWSYNGEKSGSRGQAKRLEGIEIQLTGEVAKHYDVVYRVHCQTYGWMSWLTDGKTSGTTGEGKRLEAIEVKLTGNRYYGGISYRTHVQTYGWETKMVSNGAMSGTSGQAKRLEAIELELYGEVAYYYDVYYRVHAQSYGWLGWAKNGETAGTSGMAKRLEAIQIKLVPKNSDTSQFEDGKKAYIKGTPTANYSTQAQEVLAQCNAQRQANGIAALSLDPELTKAANIRAQEIATLFSHTRPDGRKCFTVLDQIGYSYWSAGENIAAGYGNSSAVMNGWMNSPGHRSNILNAGFKRLGVGYVYIPNSEYGYYWVQIFSN